MNAPHVTVSKLIEHFAMCPKQDFQKRTSDPKVTCNHSTVVFLNSCLTPAIECSLSMMVVSRPLEDHER